MSVIEKTIALLGGLSPADVQALPPAQRRRFADMCKHWANLAERHGDRHGDTGRKVGVLSDLQSRRRDE
jgi:hypothetical protein